jgi:predicted dehydrogenase
VVERNSDNAAARYPGITTYRTVEELLADSTIKLIVVASPNATHFDIAMLALEAAKNVVVDKPAAITSAEIAQLTELAGGIGLHIIPFHNRRWDGDFKTVQTILDEKQLGTLAHFESTFDRWSPGPSRRAWKEDAGEGGVLLDLGTHLVDQALVLFGIPAFVGADVRREREGEGANDAFTIRLRYFTGLTVTLGANCLSSLPRPRFHLRGTRGNYGKWGLDPQEEALGAITRIESADWGTEPADRWGTLFTDTGGAAISKPVPTAAGDYREFYAGVRDALLGTAPVPVTALDAWRTARILEWAIESSKTSRDIECDWTAVPD